MLRVRSTDFAYLAFTIGMTFQVSDTDLTTKEIRTTALHHALISYVFGAPIIATAINLVAGLTKYRRSWKGENSAAAGAR